MNRLTKTGAISAKDINELLDENSENQMGKTNAYYKLQAYEDMEEALENVFGDCSDLLKTVVKTLTSHINEVNTVME